MHSSEISHDSTWKTSRGHQLMQECEDAAADAGDVVDEADDATASRDR